MFHNNCDNYAQDNDKKPVKKIPIDFTDIELFWDPETQTLRNFDKLQEAIIESMKLRDSMRRLNVRSLTDDEN